MKKLFNALFSEKSNISIMRVMSIVSLLVAAYLAIKGQHESVSTFVYAAFGGKAIQRYIEDKNSSDTK